MNRRFKAILGLIAFFALAAGMNASPNPAVAAEVDMAEITKKVFPSVVRVEVRNAIRRVATGVVFDQDGHIVTTALVSPRDEKIYIITSEGEQVDAEFLGMDAQTNLAVIKVKDKKLTPIEMGEIKDMTPGAWIGIVGYSQDNTPQVTQGICSSLGEETLRLNVWVWKGSSGSPVVDNKGRMIGLLRGVYTDESPVVIEFRERQVVGSGYMISKAEAPSSGLAMAVPIPIVKDVSIEIKEKGKVERGWLGVRIGEEEEGRVEIIEIDKDSPAEKAGLEEGDIILEFDGKPITSGEKLVYEVRKRKPGETVSLKIERDEKAKNVNLEMGEYTEQDIWKEFELKFPSLFQIPEPEVPSRQMQRTFRFPFEGLVPREKSGNWVPFSSRKQIGVAIETLDEDLSAYFGLKDGVGILIRKIDENSPADKAGLKVGDLIIKADGKRVESTAALIDLIQAKKEGDTIKLEILRDKKKMTVNVEINEEEREFGSWSDYSDAAKKQLSGWKDQYSEEYTEKMKKFNEEMKRLNENLLQELKKRSQESEKILHQTIKTYQGIKA